MLVQELGRIWRLRRPSKSWAAAIFAPPLPRQRVRVPHTGRTSGASVVTTAALGAPPHGLALVTSATGPTGLYVFADFKSFCPRLRLPVSPNLGVEGDPPLWTLTGLDAASTIGAEKN